MLNPITIPHQLEQKEKIKTHFGEIGSSEDGDYLSLIKYVLDQPEKCYSRNTYNALYGFLQKTFEKDPDLLIEIINTNTTEIDLAFRNAEQVNELEIHDIELPELEVDLIIFIDSKVHFNYLKLLESSFHTVLKLLATYTLIKKSKSTNSLDLFNCVEQLHNTEFEPLTGVYDHLIRNGIAHGKTFYSDKEIRCQDKNGNSKTITNQQAVRNFDKLLDVVNGMLLAVRKFILGNLTKLKSIGIQIPQHILVEELKMQTVGPAWEVRGCYDGFEVPKIGKQLVIYVKNQFYDYNKVLLSSFTTASLAEKFTSDYARILLSIESTKSRFASWTSYDVNKLRILRKNNFKQTAESEGVMIEKLLFFIPRFKFPRIIYFFGTLRMSSRVIGPAYRDKVSIKRKPFRFRDIKFHANKWYTVVEKCSVYIDETYLDDIEYTIKMNAKRLLRQGKYYRRQYTGLFTKASLLPVRFCKVFVYQRDLRLRTFKAGGLTSDLICIIYSNNTKGIKRMLPFGKVEDFGVYQIIWNTNYAPLSSHLPS